MEVEDLAENEETEENEKKDGLSQKATEEKGEPKDRGRDGAGGWYKREPIAAREEGGERIEGEGGHGDEVLEDERGRGEGPEVPGVGMEEGRKPKALSSPPVVSQKMKDEHEITHLPYRSWCPHCVSGRGRCMHHQSKRDGKEENVPRVAMDYFYMHSNTDGTDDERSPSIILVNEWTGSDTLEWSQEKVLVWRLTGC